MGALAQQTFLRLSLYAKLHGRLDRVDARYRHAMERIEEEEIRAYNNDARYAELEAMKKELLSIRFVQKEDLAEPVKSS